MSKKNVKKAKPKQDKIPRSARDDRLPEKIRQQLRSLPSNPGVYRFFDESGQIIYIGKAKNLKNRVRSYFRKNHTGSAWTHQLIPQIRHIEWTIVNSEVEALLLESTLIKEHRPKYNVVLKDDKNYNLVRIDPEDDFPRLETVRRRGRDHARYFGPFTDGTRLHDTLQLLRYIFQLRTCKNIYREVRPGEVKVLKKFIAFPCLRRSIGRCHAPCIGAISKAEYHELIKKVIQFFEGKYEIIEQDLQKQMEGLVIEKKFEKAAQIRDQLLAIQKITEQQRVILDRQIDEDVWGLAHSKHLFTITLLQIRSGRLLDQKNFILSGAGEPDWHLFLHDYYLETSDLPESILFPADLEDRAMLEELLRQKIAKKLAIIIPQKGEKKKLISLATRNAEDYLRRQQASFEAAEGDDELGRKLADALGFKNIINTIEGFDISHLGGTETVASCVRFSRGRPDSGAYRRFTLRTIQKGEIDDFKSMREVLDRHLSKLQIEQGELAKLLKEQEKLARELEKIRKKVGKKRKGFANERERMSELEKELKNYNKKQPLSTPALIPAQPGEGSKGARTCDDIFPDLILIDGGRGQLSAAYKILQEHHLQEKIHMIGLAKREEEIFLPGKSEPIILSKRDPVLRLLQQVRDEAHRFAITHQRSRHRKSVNKTRLEDIPGIGAETRKKLVQVFGSTLALKKATQAEIAAVVGDKLAEKIKREF